MSQIGKIHAKIRPDATVLPDFASILVVDDQRFDRARLIRLIGGLEFDTHVAEADSLETMGSMLQKDKFDLILLDYNLPDGTGLQGLEAVRLDPKNRQAATIMITGDDQNEIAIEALKRGCSDYITKDDLSPAAFRRASINALQKSHLSIGIENQDSKRQKMEAVLERFSTECASEIKPVVSRMMRQMRDLREAPSLSKEQATERICRIEKSCMRLWEFLDDLERYKGTDLSHQAFSEQSAAAALGVGESHVSQQVPPVAPPPSDAPVAKPRRLTLSKNSSGKALAAKRKSARPSVFGKPRQE
ncbi:response regulator [Roseobacter sp. YSTF-M11]|uniref:Response regulator n=1 Tax=Roseobacter insulae TaxID=2859783 RepID=A0A9X1FZB1_9RHOB|nr:response regulator [Roseobacter insulae]MBW4710336.1 response regulator [Roseobacter insulae]